MRESIDRRRVFEIPWSLFVVALMAGSGAGCTVDNSAGYCGMPGSHSKQGESGCDCSPGYVWENADDPGNFNCVLPLGPTGCVPDCTGRACGFDPRCGVSCGTCATGMCNEAGACTDQTCAKDCSGLRCGPDPVCGQSCGTCSAGTCNNDGQCTNAGVACNLVTQQPCLSIEKCTLNAADVAVCAALPSIASSRDEGETCSFTSSGDNCWRGLLCAQLTTGETPKCHKLCDLNGTQGSTCAQGGASACVFEVNSAAGLCSLPCNPFANDCPAQSYCATMLPDTALVFTCLTVPAAGLTPLGTTCATLEECEAGAVCVDAGDGPRCARLCDATHTCGGVSCSAMGVDGTTLAQGFCAECYPSCNGQACGVESTCGTSCGTCAGAAVCNDGACCTPSCGAKVCGVDAVCGASCGTCASGSVCTAAGTCCTPNCAGRECGLDPVCGVSCGSCSGNESCSTAGQCVCVPDCSGRTCGPDPKCGTSCGSCGSGTCLNGSCCTPNCSGRQCGPDPVCGTTCGFCGSSQYCSGSSCAACKPLNGSCSSTSQCCQQAGVAIECNYGSCEQCAGLGVDCSSVGCCSGLFCNPAGMCNPRDCSELGMRCTVKSDCCDGNICDADAGYRCERCREQNYACTTSSQCCSGLTCKSGSCQP